MSLDRGTILRHAFTILNETGVESLTLRRLAARLGVQAPAIYWHFKNKQDLLDEMASQIFREALEQSPAPDETQSWQDWAREYALGLRRTLLRYREGAKMFSGTYLTDASLYATMDASLRKLTAAGLALRQAVMAMSTLYCFTVGFVIEEQAMEPLPGERDSRYDVAHRASRIDPELYPLVYAAGAEMFVDQEDRFRASLKIIVAGIATSFDAERSQV